MEEDVASRGEEGKEVEDGSDQEEGERHDRGGEEVGWTIEIKAGTGVSVAPAQCVVSLFILYMGFILCMGFTGISIAFENLNYRTEEDMSETQERFTIDVQTETGFWQV